MISNFEIDENEAITRAEKTPMFGISNLLKRFEQPRKKTRVGSSKQLLANDIYEFFKPISYPRILKDINEVGEKAMYEIFNEVRQSDCDKPIALFLWKIKEEKKTIRLSTV